MKLTKEFKFEAAHSLPNVPSEHPCSSIHGHSFKVVIEIEGDVEPKKGWVIDYHEIKRVVLPLIEKLDHTYLNEIEGLENPTSENLAIWIWDRVKPDLTLLNKVIVKEAPTTSCIYSGNRKV